jgi:hypothetical protein
MRAQVEVAGLPAHHGRVEHRQQGRPPAGVGRLGQVVGSSQPIAPRSSETATAPSSASAAAPPTDTLMLIADYVAVGRLWTAEER